MIFEKGPETRIRLRKGELEKLGITTEGAVLSGKAALADALDRQARALANRQENPELDRLRQQLGGDRRR